MARLKERRFLGLLGFLLCLIGGVLLIRAGIDFRLTLEAITGILAPLSFGIVAVVGAFFIYTKRYEQGGILSVVVGLLAILLGQQVTEAVIVLLGGILGLLAAPKR
ncbi:MAG: hypothetical protein ACE5HJ_03185 [Thermoplasmata archaeon]